MAEAGLHFSQPWWLLALLALLPVALWLRYSTQKAHKGPLHLYADEHLLPHLSDTRELRSSERWNRFGRWSLMWILGVLAMAGPRWDYTDMRLFHPGNNLLVLLDISRSMQATDVSPSRLGRAKQEIQDLIILNRAVRIGLIAYASTPHVISPITEDTESIRRSLPALNTELVRMQGSRLGAALERAEQLFAGLSEDSAKTLLIISDGDFDEPGLVEQAAQLAKQDIRILTLGIGSSDGAPVPAPQGGVLTNSNRQTIQSRLNAGMLQQLAQAGQGFYQEAGFRAGDSQRILEASAQLKPAKDQMNESTRVWNERFYLLLLPLLALLLPAFRRPAARRREAS